jgi:predicted component of type VI protein secretion system
VEIILKVKTKADESVQNVRHPVNGRLMLGRGPDSAVTLDAPGISREHLEVHAEESELFLTDLSSNGTWINGARMPQRRKCKVREGDLIELPGYEIQFQIGRAANAAAMPAAGGSNPPRLASAPSGTRAASFAASFTPLELFLVVVMLASVALCVLYFAS